MSPPNDCIVFPVVAKGFLVNDRGTFINSVTVWDASPVILITVTFRPSVLATLVFMKIVTLKFVLII